MKIRNISSRDIIGGGGPSKGQGTDVYRSVVQIKDVHTKGMRLDFIESSNRSGFSRVEDQVNIYRSGGLDADNPFLGTGFFLRGSYPFPASDAIYSGAAMSTDGSSNSDYNELESGNVLFTDIWGISNGNAAFNIAVGHNIIYDRVYGITAGYNDDGSDMHCSYAGAWSGDFYGNGVSKTNFIKNAVMGFTRTKDGRGRLDFSPDTTPGSIINPTSLPDPITKETENEYFRKWVAFLNLKGETCGSRFAGA